jgi:hypothetical protein
MTMMAEICDVTVNIETGWLSVNGGSLKSTIHVNVIPSMDEAHAHEIWRTICDGFTNVTSWKTLEHAPGHRMYVQKDNERRYLSVYIHHN